jgi:hypothetical protein
MPGSWPPHELPNLNDASYRQTSSFSRRYNCIAWAADDSIRWWWPDPFEIGYWPPDAPRAVTVAAFGAAFATLGYALCADGSLEPGVEKIALYGSPGIHEPVTPTHAARQLDSGEWTSKIGIFEDIVHETIDAVSGPGYGSFICCMSRPRAS